MKFDSISIVNYINSLINELIHNYRLNLKKDELFILVFRGTFNKEEIRTKNKKQRIMYLHYESDFYYESGNDLFYPIRKPYVYKTHEIPFINKKKEKLKLDVEENWFIEKILYDLLAAIALGQGCLDFRGILDGTAELGVNDKRTPLEIIKKNTR